METLRRFRLMAVQFALLATVIGAAVAWALLGMSVAVGVMLGGIGGTLAFWLTAVKAEKVATLPPSKVKFHAYAWKAVSLAIHAAVLVRAYYLEPDTMYPLIGAVCGLFVIRAVVVALGVTGFDLKAEERKTDGTDR